MKKYPETIIRVQDEGVSVHHSNFHEDDEKALEQVMLSFYAFLSHMKQMLGLGNEDFKFLVTEILRRDAELLSEGE